jgi:hypothetical protein
MRVHEGRLEEITLDETGSAAAWISCPSHALPSPGQYTLAFSQNDEVSVLPAALYPERLSGDRFRASLPRHTSWQPGQALRLKGPAGKGFQLPVEARRVVLVSLGRSIGRLMPLSQAALEQECAVTLYGDCDFTGLPVSLEAYPLSAFHEALSWADYIAADLPLELLEEMPQLLRLENNLPACPFQVLVVGPVPCGGIGECGACAVKTRRGWKVACQEGPVFNYSELET